MVAFPRLKKVSEGDNRAEKINARDKKKKEKLTRPW
jgi:hypothetical protein